MMQKICSLLVVSTLICLSQGQGQKNNGTGVVGNFYLEEYYDVPLDHFSFATQETFPIRYLINDTYWDKSNDGPIFFYTGNEGSIEAFAESAGFMWDIAKEFGALLIFAEHRFYGSSAPSDTLKYKLEKSGIRIMGYLTVSQTLADYAQLISDFKKANNAENSPVIAFGGSYGGVLTAWMRMKYPHIVAGGISASAPFYLQSLPCNTFDTTLASIYGKDGDDNCVNVIRKSWDYLNHLGKTSKGRKYLSKTWKLCDPIKKFDDISSLKNYLESMYGFLGMANYPYAANFLQDLPAYPVKKFCSHLSKTEASNERQVMKDIFIAINVYMNNSGTVDCFDYSDESMYSSSYSSNDDTAFNYQSCTELIDPECDDGVHDFFEPQTWNFEEFSQQCFDTYHVRPQPNLTDIIFGGKDIIAASNIVFSNGLLDPWYSYGVLGNISDTLIAIVMADAAHHLDLRAANPADPSSVVEAREIEKSQIKSWIKSYKENQIKIQNAFAHLK